MAIPATDTTTRQEHSLHDAKALIRAIVSRARLQLAALTLLTLVLLLFEGAGLLLVLPLLAGIGLAENSSAGQSRLADAVRGAFEAVSLPLRFESVVSAYLLLIVSYAALSYLRRDLQAAVQIRFVARLQADFFRDLLSSTWRAIAAHRRSDLLHVMTEEISQLGSACQYVVRLLVDCVLVAAYLLFAFAVSPLLAAAAAASGALLLFLCRRLVRRSPDIAERYTAEEAALYELIGEGTGGAKVIKSFGREAAAADLFDQQVGRLAASARLLARTSAALVSYSLAGAAVLLVMLLTVSIKAAGILPATLVLLTLVYVRLIPKLSALQMTYQQLQEVLPAFARVERFWGACRRAREVQSELAAPDAIREALELRGLRFSYSAGRPVLADASAQLKAGKVTAIVGKTGAGKSTLLDIAAGLLAPDGGSVLVDGAELVPGQLAAWRRRVGYVGQQTFLFPRSIRENLLWLDRRRLAEDIERVLEIAALSEFIAGLPDGLDTPIGDEGVRLSGGERQRLALARAMLAEPILLILDEATNALDRETEARVLGSLRYGFPALTILFATHRESSLEGFADTIYRLNDGRLECLDF